LAVVADPWVVSASFRSRIAESTRQTAESYRDGLDFAMWMALFAALIALVRTGYAWHSVSATAESSPLRCRWFSTLSTGAGSFFIVVGVFALNIWIGLHYL
jgi:hypothetical protein